MKPQSLAISIGEGREVSGLLCAPAGAKAGYVLAHGAGAGIAHAFMAAAAGGLAERGIATLRYNFHYMEQKSKRPDSPKIAHAAVRAAVAAAHRLLPGMPLFAGGKSFGGRMTSQAEALQSLDVRGLAFLGFPLHPAGKPGTDRAQHLEQVAVPMLFLQGSRDELAQLHLLMPVVKELGPRATLRVLEDADHSFHVPARSGRKDAQVLDEALDALSNWIAATQ